MGYSPRYHIGYNRPVKGAFGGSPVEWYCSCETDNLEVALEERKALRGDGHAAFVFDTVDKKIVDDGADFQEPQG